MVTMILKMSAITLLFSLLTLLVGIRTDGKKFTPSLKIVVGLAFGIFSILSTHFGVDYQHMMLNVRDLGPLSAGLFFDPVSGILAGLIGGIERYIAGAYFGVGSYTQVACSVSTCLAGFLAALLRTRFFKNRRPSVVYAFIIGAVMEVFHMYAVLLTHRDDIRMALYVVKVCSVPMILFSGFGLAFSCILLQKQAGEKIHLFINIYESREIISVTTKFQFYLLVITGILLSTNLALSYSIQNQTSFQNARDTLYTAIRDIRDTYQNVTSNLTRLSEYAERIVLRNTKSIAAVVDSNGSVEQADTDLLEKLCEINNLDGFTLFRSDGSVVRSLDDFSYDTSRLQDVLSGKMGEKTYLTDNDEMISAVHCQDGMLATHYSMDKMYGTANVDSLARVLSYYHVGRTGAYDIVFNHRWLTAGTHEGSELDDQDRDTLENAPRNTVFETELFGVPCLACTEQLSDYMTIVVNLPLSEVYEERSSQMYEIVFADILLFAVMYSLISFLVQQIIGKNLGLITSSLSRITAGNLNEVVNVRSAAEFASLSDDINKTVDTLKGYIEAAKKRIEQELEFARTIQDSALPKNFVFPRNDFELYATMDPAKEVGGDFYDFFFVDQNKLAMVIADVSGKGIPAALFMMRSKTAIRGLAAMGSSPSEILYRANNTLCEGNDAEMFVTVWLGIMDLKTGIMTFANAGHEYPYLMRAGGDYEIFKDRHGMPLAGLENMRYTEHELKLDIGDSLFVYTDGIPEAINSDIEQYGEERLTNVLNQVKNENMKTILLTVRQDIKDFVGDADQFDDITMLGFVYYGSGKDG